MKWTDILEIALALDEAHPEVDPQYVSFVDLHNWVVGLDGFDDVHDRSNERILEAIQMTWIEEQD